MSSQNNIYVNAFNLIAGIGPQRFKKLAAYFPSWETAWQADTRELLNCGLEEKIAIEIVNRRNQIDPIGEYQKLIDQKINTLIVSQIAYPSLLKEIYDPPAIIYCRGQMPAADQIAIGIVGTRKPSAYGQQVATKITGELASQGLIVVSGLALGIDSLAHQSALENDGKTIAVLGSGLGWPEIYPSSNRHLAEKIIVSGGAIISEHPLGIPAQKQHFPTRNRIISGLSAGVLVIEAAEKSGSLITAQQALEQNRDVFAVPGSIYNPNSIGTNNLIKSGAKLVINAQEILEELAPQLIISNKPTKKIMAADENETLILRFLSHDPLHVDKITILTKLDTASLNSTLAVMELAGKIKDVGGMNYVLAS